ncbi:complement resistance protein TraT [Paraburkholderia youngii]|uniref:complement resistance protein TraT n=1 Tax=Paraburkholderia youngii TaxID=2782701 RepID=UPI0016163834|nr:complement resistance protein TraT [Paraburkholderia youngii]
MFESLTPHHQIQAKSPVTATGLFAFWARLYRSFSTYQTRILSVANKVNLDFAEAAPPLRSGLVRVIAGPFQAVDR